MRLSSLRYHVPLMALTSASVLAFVVTLFEYLPNLTALDAGMLFAALTPLILLANPSPAPRRSFWSRLVARVPSPVPRTN